MGDSFLVAIKAAVATLETQIPGREKSIIMTKLDEARLWYNALQARLKGE